MEKDNSEHNHPHGAACCSQPPPGPEPEPAGEPRSGAPTCSHGPHHIAPDSSGTRLLITLAINLIIPVAQLIGGIQAHSMALISDAAHNFSDFTAVFIAYVANRIGQRGASPYFTFGYRRAEILAAALNVMLLFGACGFIVFQAAHRVLHPEAVGAQLVIVIAGIGVVGNGLSAWLLHRDAGHNLNVRGAFLHMLGDLFTSVVVVLNGVILLYRPWYWLDPLLSILIAVFIVRNCWVILKQAVCILMNAAPDGLDIDRVKRFLERVPGVRSVHYLHAWNLCSSSVAFSCHIVVPDQKLSGIQTVASKVREGLLHKFGIDHPVLQFETDECGQGETLCGLSCGNGSNGCRQEDPIEAGGGHAGSLLARRFFLAVRLALGAIFVLAAISKIAYPGAFAEIVANYQLLPDTFVNGAAIFLPWLELLLGLLLLAGFWLPGSALLSLALLTIFLSALLFNMARGLNVHCGCFSVSMTGSPHMLWYLVRDSFFLLLGAALCYFVYFGPPEKRVR